MDFKYSKLQAFHQAKGDVRSFSRRFGDESPDSALARSLASKESKDEDDEIDADTLVDRWQRLFIPRLDETYEQSNEDSALNKSSHDLAQAWLRFQKCLPERQQCRVQDAPPNLSTVIEAVIAANLKWKSGREGTKAGKAKGLFGTLCGTLDDYSDLFAVIPSGDKYICLLTGSLSAIVKATINHEKVAEGFSYALDDLSEDIGRWKRQLKIHGKNRYVTSYIAQLYVIVFQFLVDMMTKWYKSSVKRFLHSFDNNFFDDQIKYRKDQIKVLKQRIESEAKLATEATIQELPKVLDDAIKTGLAKFSGLFAQEMDNRFGELGRQTQGSLRSAAIMHYMDYQYVNGLDVTRSIGPSPTSMSPIPCQNRHSKQIIGSNADHLRKYSQDEIVTDLIDRASGLGINHEVFRQVQQWTSEKVSRAIWIYGPFRASVPSRYTLISAYIVATGRRAGIPVAAYFCQMDLDNNQVVNDTIEGGRTAELVYSLIYQVAQQIPLDFVSQVDFSAERFAGLDRASGSLADAVSLLRDLIVVGPGLLFCVIDGLQILENGTHDADNTLLGEIIEILRGTRMAESSGCLRVVKAFFTTDGFADALSILDCEERVDATYFGRDDEVGSRPNETRMAFLHTDDKNDAMDA